MNENLAQKMYAMKIELKDLSNLELLKRFLVGAKYEDHRNIFDEDDNFLLKIQEEILSRMTQPEVVKLIIK